MSGSRRAPEKSNFLQTCNLLSRYIKEKGSLRDLNLEIGGKVESLDAIVKPGSSLSATMKQQLSMDPSSVIIIDDCSDKTSMSKEGTSTTAEPKVSQLTIFYSGRVLVFDDYPVDKARELVSIAKKSSSQMSYGILPDISQLEKPKTNPTSREGLPPRPHLKAGISSNACKEKSNATTSGAAAASSSAREGLLLRPQPPGGKEKAKAAVVEATAAAGNSRTVQEQASPAPSDANGSDLPIARRSSLHRFLEKRKDRAAARGPYHIPEQGVDGGSSSSSKDDEHLDLNL